MDNKKIASELMKVARLFISLDHDYLYDPKHEHKPSGSGWERTEKGWSKGGTEDPKPPAHVTEQRDRTKKHMDSGLRKWVGDYKKMKQEGNTEGAKQVRNNIVKTIKEHDLDEYDVFNE